MPYPPGESELDISVHEWQLQALHDILQQLLKVLDTVKKYFLQVTAHIKNVKLLKQRAGEVARHFLDQWDSALLATQLAQNHRSNGEQVANLNENVLEKEHELTAEDVVPPAGEGNLQATEEEVSEKNKKKKKKKKKKNRNGG
eukprot:3004124-Rhodomonas_salina.2